MKLPKDAVVEWRCRCGGLCGYVRVVDDKITWTHRARGIDRGWGSRPPRGAGGEALQDVEVTEQFRRMVLRSTGLTVSCGRHLGQVYEDDFLPGKGRRRRVVVKAITEHESIFPSGSTDEA